MTPSKLSIRKRSRARRGEEYVGAYRFPAHIEKRVRRRFPDLDDAGWAQVEQGLREWFVCCAWRGRTVLGMPSRLVDEAWHEFILDSLAYTGFCQAAFGEYLHHTPDEAMEMPGDTLGDSVRAWDRSGAGGEGESVLWDLDRRLGVEQPLGLDGVRVAAARSRSPHAGGKGVAAGGGAVSAGFGGGGGDGGGSGDSGGGGCGGGCGGGS